MKKSIAVICFLLIGFSVFSQTKKIKKLIEKPIAKEEIKITSYEILENGDTINKIDTKKNKQGKWLITYPKRYGEEGFLEYGQYINNYKVGIWKKYTLTGIPISFENFKKGKLDGEATYFEDGQISCVGNYLALNANKIYDTILVEDPITNNFKSVVIKTEVGSVKHGIWTFYKPFSKQIKKVVEYSVDEIVYEKEYISKQDSIYIEQRKLKMPHITNKEPEGVWHFDKKKKPVKYTND